MIHWKDIAPLSEVEELECLPAVQSVFSHNGVFLDNSTVRLYTCYCKTVNSFSVVAHKTPQTLRCRHCGREWCYDHVDASLCRITDDKAVLHELTI